MVLFFDQEKGFHVSRVFITGSTDGLGLAAATLLLSQGHEVMGHARNGGRAADRCPRRWAAPVPLTTSRSRT